METTQESITTFEEQDLAYIESFSEWLDKTGDTIERSFAEQLYDSGERLSPEHKTTTQPNHKIHNT